MQFGQITVYVKLIRIQCMYNNSLIMFGNVNEQEYMFYIVCMNKLLLIYIGNNFLHQRVRAIL